MTDRKKYIFCALHQLRRNNESFKLRIDEPHFTWARVWRIQAVWKWIKISWNPFYLFIRIISVFLLTMSISSLRVPLNFSLTPGLIESQMKLH